MTETWLIKNNILKPSFSSAQLSHDVVVPLTIFDKAALNLHVESLHAFKPPMPSNEVLKNALSKVLAHFPHFTGRLTVDKQGHQCIVLNNAGIRIIETYVPMKLADELPFDPSKDVSYLIPPVDGIDELLQIQLNRYACGGLVIGHTAHHRVVDAGSGSFFFVAWGRLVRGLDIEKLPYHDRAAIFVPRNQLRVDYDHRFLLEFGQGTTNPKKTTPLSSITHFITHFSTEIIEKIKALANKQISNPKQRNSTFECLLAQVWKKGDQARGLELDEFTEVKLGVNVRRRMKPPVPMEYFGNLVLSAYPRLTVREVLMESHAYVAKAIHDAVSMIDNDYIQSFIDFGELSKRNGEILAGTTPEVGQTLCPNLEVDSWLRFSFHDLDFGGGPPCAFYSPNFPVEGVLLYENIIKSGDPPLDSSATKELYDQLQSGVYLEQKKKKYWIDKESRLNCFMVFPRGLAITGMEQLFY
ncbi:hypothetical protein IFM89_028767 [Coptis chinensis]|uniref:Uncharacterized protein n=1 Tax=Coptis chinensis TaxID=261450 RepID=A0A835H138_9MAGN|nr:hypothetical protein IFM89_028767 [Coptis chinensis]